MCFEGKHTFSMASQLNWQAHSADLWQRRVLNKPL